MPSKGPHVTTSALKMARKRVSKRSQGVARMTDVQELKLLERRYQVWKMRKDGTSVREIALTLKIKEDTVRQDIYTIGQRMAKEMGESVEEMRYLQMERLDALLVKYQPLAEAGSVPATQMVLQIEARRAKLMALDTPEQKRLEVTGIREYVGINLDEV